MIIMIKVFRFVSFPSACTGSEKNFSTHNDIL